MDDGYGYNNHHRGFIRGIGSYFSQIWGGGEADGVPFYPLWFNQFLNRKLPVILDTNNLMLVYASVPIYRTVIDFLADIVGKARLELYKVEPDGSNGEQIYDHPILTLLHKPHAAYASGKEFRQQWTIFRALYQTALTYKNKITRNGFPVSVIAMPTGEFKINPTGKIFDQLKFEDIVENFEHINAQDSGDKVSAFKRFYQTYEMMLSVDGPTDRYFFGIPKIITNKLLISNIQLALQTQNILLNDRGPMWLVSNSNKDSEGGLPMDADEQKRINRAFSNDYGIGDTQSRFILSSSSLNAQALGFPAKDLMTEEIKEACFVSICDMLGIQRGVFGEATVSKGKDSIGGDGKGKVEESMKITIETTGQSWIDSFCEGFNMDEDFGLRKNNKQLFRLKGSFLHLPVMQEDQVDAENVKNVKAQAAATMTTSILSLVNSVKTGVMDYDAALATLINIHGIEEDIANEILVKPKEITPPEPPKEEEPETEEGKAYKKLLTMFTL